MKNHWLLLSALILEIVFSTTARSAESAPSVIDTTILLIDLFSINDEEQSFEADFAISLAWKDQRVTDSLGGEDWLPNLQFANGRDLRVDMIRPLGHLPNGDWEIAFRIHGKFRQRFDLRQFPNDVQHLQIDLVAPNFQEGFQLNPTGILLSGTGRITSEWILSNLETRIERAASPVQGRREMTHLLVMVDAKRDPGFYLWRVVLPLCLIVFMSWTVFWIDPVALEAQLQVSCAAIITLIAFELSLSAVLPEVSYLTSLDVFVLGATVMVFVALGECILTSGLAKSGNQDSAVKIDHLARWCFPSAFALLLALVWLTS